MLGLRPTGNRGRERLFSWLGQRLQGAHCADLFAGSGALSFEALSRGAATCVAIDCQPQALRWLRYNAEQLQAQHLSCQREDSTELIERPPTRPMNLIFVDPPFAANCSSQVCAKLERHDWLATEAVIYVELPKRSTGFCAPANWRLWRQAITGDVDSRLYTRIEPPS